MLGFFLAPFTKLIELDFLGNKLLVLTGPVVYTLTGAAGKLEKSIL